MATVSAASSSPIARYFPALTSRWFRFILLFQLGNAIAVWSHVISGQWVLVAVGESAFIVSLIPASASIPFMLLALPLGSIVTYRRRELLIGAAMALGAIASACAAVLTWLELVTAPGLIFITLAVGVGLAVVGIAWQSMLPETVERTLIPSATVLDGAIFNAARALGPVLAGVGLVVIGPVWVFGVNATLYGISAVGMFLSRRKWPSKVGVKEPLMRSIGSGVWFARHSPWTRRLLFRMWAFGFPAASLWALLPVVAHDRLGLTSVGLGVATGMLGLGAVIGTFIIGPLRTRLPLNTFAALGSGVYGAVLLCMSLTTSTWIVVVSMIPTGIAWVAVQSTWMTLANQTLPDWVRPRMVALMLFVFQASQAIGSLAWGMLADLIGVAGAVAVAGFFLMVTVNGFRTRGLTPSAGIEPERVTTATQLETFGIRGPIQVEHTYEVSEPNIAAFYEAMTELRMSRLRLGAQAWVLLSDPQRAWVFIERYRLAHASDLMSISRDRLTIPEERLRRRVNELADMVSPPQLLSVVDLRREGLRLTSKGAKMADSQLSQEPAEPDAPEVGS